MRSVVRVVARGPVVGLIWSLPPAPGIAVPFLAASPSPWHSEVVVLAFLSQPCFKDTATGAPSSRRLQHPVETPPA